jgi:hypothetical protein
VAKGKVNVIYSAIENIAADIMTKSLQKFKHVKFTTNLKINLNDSTKTKKE